MEDIETWWLVKSVIDYTIDGIIIILGETQKTYWIIAVALNTKKVIFNAKTDGKTPKIEIVKGNVKLLVNYERLKYILREGEIQFEKCYG